MKADIFEKVFKNKTVFVTGHTGFIGSWLVQWLSDLGANVIGFSLEPPTNPSLFESIKLEKKLVHIIGNVNDQTKLEKSMQEHSPQFVFHLAAQPLVSESFQNPVKTFYTNVMGTINLLEAAKNTKSIKSIVIIGVTVCLLIPNPPYNWAFAKKGIDKPTISFLSVYI